MSTSYGALCTDFFVNQKIGFKMPLPRDRETVLHFFDLTRKAAPQLNRFRRYDDEFLIESARQDSRYQWVSVHGQALRGGAVNPDTMDEAYDFLRQLAAAAPYHLTVSPIDIDHLELTFGFELECDDDQDAVVARALFDSTPLGSIMDIDNARVLRVQPSMSLLLNERGDRQAFFEVKTRRKSRRGSSKAHRDEPIGLYLSVRQYGPIDAIDRLAPIFDELRAQCETLAEERFLPHILTPISEHIPAGGK